MATSTRKETDLERLTQPGGKVMPDDASIPVLTERLTLPSLDLDISLPQPPPPVVAAPSPSPMPVLPQTPAPVAVSTIRPAPTPTPTPAAAAPTPPPFAPSLYAAPTPPPVPTIDWDKIEAQLRESLLRELQPQLTAELEKQVRDRLQPTLVRALTALVSDLRPALDSTVRDTISRAIAAEVERQRSLS